MGIGEKLREAREKDNITLNELQEITKIQVRYLRAIEEGNFHVLPGSFYARAFIKEYAHAVGLNANELFQDHEDELPSIGERRSGAQYTRLQRTRKSNEPSRASAFFSFLPTVIVILLVIGIISLAIYFYKQKTFDPAPENEQQENDEFYRKKGENTQPDNETEDNDENNENNEEPEDVIETPEDELTLTDTIEGRIPESTFEFTHHGDEIQLTIESSGKAWLNVDNNNNESFYADFITEESSPLIIDVSEEEVIYLNIGHSPAVEININDLQLEYPIDVNERVHQKVVIHIKQNE